MHGPGQHAVSAGRATGAAKVVGCVLAAIVLLRFLILPAYPILDRSEARYAFIGELMAQTGNWITPFIDHGVPFWAKPPFSTWVTAASYLTFGFNEFAARLPSFLIFALTAGLAFLLGRQERDQEFG